MPSRQMTNHVSRAEKYLAYADECSRWASEAVTDLERAFFAQRAQEWVDAASVIIDSKAGETTSVGGVLRRGDRDISANDPKQTS